MKIDAILGNAPLSEIPEITRVSEALAFDGFWSQETDHDPFLPLALAAEHSSRIEMGTSIAVAFSRSPMNLAYTAWDLARQSQGRFILGLGTQVQAHIERRFGAQWPSSPVAKLGEMIDAIRSIWDSWQTGSRLNFRGEYFRLGLMTPFFTPAPLECKPPAIFIAGVNRGMATLAGIKADGFLVHPYHTLDSITQITLPAIEKGLRESGRDRQYFKMAFTVFTATSSAEVEEVRKQIAFYASTPNYASVLKLEGGAQVAAELSALARRGKWEEMPALIKDAFLEKVCVVAEDPKDLATKLLQRYGNLADRLSIYKTLDLREDSQFWKTLIAGLRAHRPINDPPV